MNALSAVVLVRPLKGYSPTSAEVDPVAEIDCIHWLSPSHAGADGVDVPHWLIDQRGENE